MNLPSLPSKETFPGRGKSVWSSLAVTESGDQGGSPWEPHSVEAPAWNEKQFSLRGPGRSPGDYEMGWWQHSTDEFLSLRFCRSRERSVAVSLVQIASSLALLAMTVHNQFTISHYQSVRWHYLKWKNLGRWRRGVVPRFWVEPRQPGWQLEQQAEQQLEQLPIRQPEQEQPRQPQEQPGLPPREHHPAAPKMARTNGPIHRFPCSALAAGSKRPIRGAGPALRHPWRAEPNPTRGAAVGKLRPGAPSPKLPRLTRLFSLDSVVTF